MNKVLAGKYEGKLIMTTKGKVLLATGFNPVEISKENVLNYEVITEEHRKSAASGVARGLVGGALLGPVGMLAGGLSAKNKGTHNIAIEFESGERSLIQVDSKIYKTLMVNLFQSNIESEAKETKDKVDNNILKKILKVALWIVLISVIVAVITQIISGNPIIQ